MDKKFLEEHYEEIIGEMMEKMELLRGLLELEIIENKVVNMVLYNIYDWQWEIGNLIGYYHDKVFHDELLEEYKKNETKLKAV